MAIRDKLYSNAFMSWGAIAIIMVIILAMIVWTPPTVTYDQRVASAHYDKINQTWRPLVRIGWTDADAGMGNLGSGVAFRRVGTYVYVLTANHVVEPPTHTRVVTVTPENEIQIVLVPLTLNPVYTVGINIDGGLGELTTSAVVVATNPTYDLAIVRFDYGIVDFPLAVLSLPGEYEPTMFDTVWAAGHQLGRRGITVDGMITVERDDILGDGVEFIESTTPILPGSSGGPLFALVGGIYKVIGIQLRVGGAPHMAFSVPIKYFWMWYEADDLDSILTGNQTPCTPTE